MTKSNNLNHFSVLVIGNNPNDDILKFDMLKDESEPYILYKYSDIGKIRKNRIKFYEQVKEETNDQKIKDGIDEQIKLLKDHTDLNYYISLGELYSFDSQKNIISTENPNGRWMTCEIGGVLFKDYMKDYNDNGITSTYKSKIDWGLTHMRSDKVVIYGRAWDLCVNKDKPLNEKELNIINNMAVHDNYFKRFKNKNEYIKYSCSFWTYGVVKDGIWIDMESVNDIEWVTTFYDKYIKGLSGDTKITIYECTK